MEIENNINCNCLDIVYDEKTNSLKNGKYATIDSTDKGNNLFISVGGFDVNNNNLPDYVIKRMETNRNMRPTTLAQNVVKEDRIKAQEAKQKLGTREQQTSSIVGDKDK